MGKLSLKDFFETELRAGQTQNNAAYKILHYHLGKHIHQMLEPKSITEIGCGPGAMMEYFLRNTDVQYVGIDINPYSRDYFIERNPGNANNYALVDAMEYGFHSEGDVVVSIETFEHIEDHILEHILPKMARSYKWFYFSSTPFATNPEQDIAWGHINLKADHQWVKLFRRHGWVFEAWLNTPTEWSMLFKSTLNI